MSNSVKTVIELLNVSKRYGEITVLRSVKFDLLHGEVHGLIGENGAGKSTAMRLVAGVYHDYEGEMKLHGKSIRFASPAEAQDNGIGMVHQELSNFSHLSVAENLVSRRLPSRFGIVNWKTMRRQARQHLLQLGLDIDVNKTMGDLPVGLQQMIEIARIIFSGAQIIILDEPTSALSPPETKRLFDFISSLRAKGKSIIFISHFLEDVLAVTDRVSVFRNGSKIETLETKQTSKEELVNLMIGSEAKTLQRVHKEINAVEGLPPKGEILFAVENLSRKNNFSDISFSVSAGEILGIFGFMGAGQISLARCLFGALYPESGSISINGKKVTLKNTTHGRNAGIAYVPENRHDALMLQQAIYKNITLSHLRRITGWLLNKKKELKAASIQLSDLMIKPAASSLPVGMLSGGNQQKVVLAKWLTHLPTLLILNEPTRGIDIGAKDEVLNTIIRLREKGVSILLITSEPELIIAIADRAIVMSKGHITSRLQGIELTKQNLMQHA